ncbi:hypothetical protein [Hyphomicrobium sulfonivorans]|uniref:hypothetical protein n=1 Tax=Hyphomicrobium sulfonivorans TaxID=121290 RepID=UPI0015704414|nr:hypothetical protein [Hyphomicrobium sulfonivorans]MBI1649790.1 hypothetical protein [Hyphomicrobium sulfonivorans]NSL71704.1 hypothetical protein [Hyphomicrobium sulfonivorans]
MFRGVVVVISGSVLGWCAALSAAQANDVCIVCEEPLASYRCVLEQPSSKVKLGEKLAREVCSKVLAQQGEHGICQMVKPDDGDACKGPERTVTLTDYQRVMSGDDTSTYEVGALEIARRNVHGTWRCVTSLFKDC